MYLKIFYCWSKTKAETKIPQISWKREQEGSLELRQLIINTATPMKKKSNEKIIIWLRQGVEMLIEI